MKTSDSTTGDNIQETSSFTLGQPIFVNPCSIEALATVFREIGKQAGIKQYGGAREWLTIVCDGLPYVLGSRIIARLHKCSACKITLKSVEDCVQHQCIVGDEESREFIQEFDWILLQPGPGHVEMNMLKGYVSLMWNVYWQDLVELFNFRSENAKKSAFQVNDHHKGMTLARIAHEALAKELVLPYIRETQDTQNLTVAGFMKFVMTKVKNVNYAFMIDAVFELLHSIFLFRDGVRSGDTQKMEAGRAVFSKVWSARHHPMYRELDMKDTIMFRSMPANLKEHVCTTMSVNITGVPNSGEGADFKLEAVNKSVQHWVPSVPSDEDWRTACANLQKLNDLRGRVLSELGVQDPKKQTTRHTNSLKDQVRAFRAIVREKEYVKDPSKECKHISFRGEELDEGLVNFCTSAREKRAKLYDAYKAHIEDELSTRTSVFFKEEPINCTK